MAEVIRPDIFRGQPFNRRQSAYEITTFDYGPNGAPEDLHKRHRVGVTLEAVLEGRAVPDISIILFDPKSDIGKRVLALIGQHNAGDSEKHQNDQGTQMSYRGNGQGQIRPH